MLVNEEVSGLVTGEDIGVIELNTNIKKIGIQKLKESMTET